MRKWLLSFLAVVIISTTAIAQTHTYPALDTNNAFTGMNSFSNPGMFTNVAGNEPLISGVGGCVPSTIFHNEQGIYLTDAGSFCIVVPSGTAVPGYAITGLVNSNGASVGGAGTAGAYLQDLGYATNGFIEGLNTLTTFPCTVTCTNASIVGYEMDIGPGSSSATSPKQIIGLDITGGSLGGPVPTVAAAISITPIDWSWHYGLDIGRAATDGAGVILDGALATNPTDSQGIALQSWSSGGQNYIQAFHNDASGNLQLLSFNAVSPKFVVNENLTASTVTQTNAGGLATPAISLASSGSTFENIFVASSFGTHALTLVDSGNNALWGTTYNTAQGVYQSVKNTAGCTTGNSIGNTCLSGSGSTGSDITVTWPTAFTDANYSVTCTGYNPTGVPSGPFITASTKTGASVHVNYFAITAASASFSSVDCIAVHD